MRSWPRDTWNQEQCQFWRKREITWREPLSNPLENLHSLITGQISSFKILRENVKCWSKIYWVTGEARWQGKSLLIVYLFNSWINTLKQQVSPAIPHPIRNLHGFSWAVKIFLKMRVFQAWEQKCCHRCRKEKVDRTEAAVTKMTQLLQHTSAAMHSHES